MQNNFGKQPPRYSLPHSPFQPSVNPSTTMPCQDLAVLHRLDRLPSPNCSWRRPKRWKIAKLKRWILSTPTGRTVSHRCHLSVRCSHQHRQFQRIVQNLYYLKMFYVLVMVIYHSGSETNRITMDNAQQEFQPRFFGRAWCSDWRWPFIRFSTRTGT